MASGRNAAVVGSVLHAASRKVKRCNAGQMTVELCIVFPVVIAIALIAVNALTFFSECAQFDRLVRNCIRIYSTSLSEGADESAVTSEIVSHVTKQMGEDAQIECQMSGSLRGEEFVTYTVTYSYAPTLFGMPLRGSVFGISLPQIKHSINMAVDPYSPGKWLWSYMH